MYQSFIGLEVHIHLLTKTKVFCGCKSAFGDEPNTNVCPVCLGYPGVLPSLNIESMRMGCTVAKALGCFIPEKTWFERKQYFYPDMTKNYQISQFASPLGQQGSVEIEGNANGKPFKKTIRIKECHLEEDAGKMIHTGAVSLLDYNRAGVSLLEIVTEPDMETGEEAEVFIQQLRRMVRYLGVCDGNMEEGSLRADANVSINLPGKGLGRKVEIKNLNSSRFVRLGLNYEIQRQGEVLDAGKIVVQETRLWNENRDQTEPMRKKENAHDYRYFPEPDLPIFTPDKAFLEQVDKALVELPVNRMKRFEAEYGLNPEQADLVCEEKEEADYFETAAAVAVSKGMDKKDAASRIANYLLGDIKHLLHKDGLSLSSLSNFKLKPEGLAALVVLISKGQVSTKNAKQTLEAAIAEGKDPETLIKEKGWGLITDPAEIAKVVKAVHASEAAVFEDVKAAIAAGNAKRRQTLTAFLVGKVLAATSGRADPKIAGQQIEALL
ncbi:Asp-tRNA(Asn)/Glu-tRNA(Gln) amidotransferase subunit GatB [Leadbettera azotonutricia]|uniref:Aspartyl/glutamyl-tRNA(Asn/Gln) amidotransferase subunit B n=1 Tax=Leadbettera azotonutricia (strain ATCC BAA-888 / DSM 13862 / ZAS-9) TaxID=545695 RepID=F5YFJ4_LEAAZ|nr:Asp-tRNA(Asn)/Glu-tRNA(Gln) amidotransferase subunit GatB [Leadbettera azotonutricia]AEF81102.1 glutamyl-tRNA(Gln) and/or aspartyl-tRNA(Asn) amidotransferase, B subunit [Leadbettera azotonutricia ZAS-9]